MKADEDRAHCPWQKRETVRKRDGYLIGLCEKHCREPLDIWPDSNSSAEGSYSDRHSLSCTHTISICEGFFFLSFKQPSAVLFNSLCQLLLSFLTALSISLSMYVFPHQNLSRTKSWIQVMYLWTVSVSEKAPGGIFLKRKKEGGLGWVHFTQHQ